MKLRHVRIRMNGGRKAVAAISDRAKRYRANQEDVRPGPPKQCGFCGGRRTIEVHHISGNEDDGEPENLMWACRSCNTSVANLMRRAGIGKLTRQFNPRRRAGGGLKGQMAAYAAAIKVMRGEYPGDVSAAVQTIHDTPPSIRSAYTARTWPIRRSRYGSSGRQTEIPF
jgi:hypothetical protein